MIGLINSEKSYWRGYLLKKITVADGLFSILAILGNANIYTASEDKGTPRYFYSLACLN